MNNKDLTLIILLAIGILCMGFALGYFTAHDDVEMKVSTAYIKGLDDGIGTVAFKPPEANNTQVFGSISGEYDSLLYHPLDNDTDNSTTLKPFNLKPYHNLTVTVLVVQSKDFPHRKGLYVYARPAADEI